MPISSPELVVVGAGPSGSAAVASLVRHRNVNRVLWLESKTFPRAKPCGDAWGPRGIRVIRQMGALERFMAGARGAVEALELFLPDGQRLRVPLPTPMVVVTRRHGDSILRDRALELAGSSVKIIEGTRVLGPILETAPEGERVVGLRTNRGDVRARLVLDASGASSQISPTFNPGKSDPDRTHSACRTYFEGVEGLGKGIELYVAEGIPGYFWIFPLGRGDGIANVGWGVHRIWLEERGIKLEEACELFMDAHPSIRRRMSGASALAPYRRWILGLHTPDMVTHAPGLFLVGEAANLVQTATGAGLPYALMSGWASGRHVAKALSDPSLEEHERLRYHRWLRRAFLRELTYDPGTEISKLFRTPRARRMDWGLRGVAAAMGLVDRLAQSLGAGAHQLAGISSAARDSGFQEVRGPETTRED